MSNSGITSTGLPSSPFEHLEALFAARRIRATRSAFFDSTPDTQSTRAWERVEGMLLGLAIGDALGDTSESLHPDERRRLYGEIRDYRRNRHAANRRKGLPSDDTQLAFFALEQRLQDAHFDPAALAQCYAREEIYGMGQSVRAFVINHRKGVHWHSTATNSAGNGALMRIASVIAPYLRAPARDLWAEAAVNTLITHNSAAAIATSVAWVAMLWDLLAMQQAPAPGWWLDRFAQVCGDIEGSTEIEPRGGNYKPYRGSLTRFVRHVIGDVRQQNLSTVDACNAWHSGAYLLETVPSVLFILERHGHDPEQAIVRAVNDTRDNDTVGAIVGAAMGALHGPAALPARWRQGLLGRIREADDGAVFALIDAARQRWG